MGEKHPYHGKSMSTNFPGSPHMMGFVPFSRATGNWWENPCISHVMKFANISLLYMLSRVYTYLYINRLYIIHKSIVK